MFFNDFDMDFSGSSSVWSFGVWFDVTRVWIFVTRVLIISGIP